MPCFGSHHPWMIATSTNIPPTRPIDQVRPAVAEISVIPPVSTKNLSTRRHFGTFSSKWPKRMLPSAKIVAITATSIHRFMIGDLASESLPQKVRVQGGDDDGHRPRERLHPPRAHERAHLVPVAGEHHEREDREGELQAE